MWKKTRRNSYSTYIRTSLTTVRTAAHFQSNRMMTNTSTQRRIGGSSKINRRRGTMRGDNLGPEKLMNAGGTSASNLPQGQ